MTSRTDIIRELLETAPGTKPRKRRGHFRKIAAAVAALRADGQIPPDPLPWKRDKLVLGWLIRHGYGDDLPSRQSLQRFFADDEKSAG